MLGDMLPDSWLYPLAALGVAIACYCIASLLRPWQERMAEREDPEHVARRAKEWLR